MNDEMPEEGSMIYMHLPPEVRAMIEHQKLHAEENAHTALRFLESLDEDQLRAFRGIISSIAAMEDSVPYFIGLTGGLLHFKFKICLGCGIRHDDELHKMAGDGPKAPVDVDAGPFDHAQYAIDMNAYEVEPDESVSIVDAGFDPETTPVYCTGPCSEKGGTRGKWANMEARKEHKAGTGGCTFCVQIEAWG